MKTLMLVMCGSTLLIWAVLFWANRNSKELRGQREVRLRVPLPEEFGDFSDDEDDPTEPRLEQVELEEPPPTKGYVTLLNGRTVEYDLPGQAQSSTPAAAEPAPPVRCNVCRRILTGKEAIRHGQGRVCRRKAIAQAADGTPPGEIG